MYVGVKVCICVAHLKAVDKADRSLSPTSVDSGS